MVTMSSDMSIQDSGAMASALRTIRYGTAVTPSKSNVITLLPKALNLVEPALFGAKKDDFCRNFENTIRFENPPKSTRGYPSVSALINATGDLTKLYEWQCRTITQMNGMKNFQTHMTQRQRSGTNFHSVVHKLLDKLKSSGELNDVDSRAIINAHSFKENQGYVTGLLPVLQQLRPVDYLCMEKKTINYYYCYQGRFDAIVEIDGEPTLVDWKTASTASIKSTGETNLESLYGEPLQIVAYINAVNSDPAWQHLPKITRGAIVLAFEDGRPAQIVTLKEDDIRRYTEIFAERINKFWYTVQNPEPHQVDILNNINFVYNPILQRPATPQRIEI